MPAARGSSAPSPRRCWPGWRCCSCSRSRWLGQWPDACSVAIATASASWRARSSSSTQERQRIAADLHDGVVQDLVGVAFGLAPLADDADRRGAGAEASRLRAAIARLRQGVRDLRTLLVEIHPPNLKSTGLEPALSDLLSPLEGEGLAVELKVEDVASNGANSDALVYRVASEAIRNIRSHANARRVRVSVERPKAETVRLIVEDDGSGFGPEVRDRRAAGGHLGLSLLEDLARQAGGSLAIQSSPGQGTRVELETPVR